MEGRFLVISLFLLMLVMVMSCGNEDGVPVGKDNQVAQGSPGQQGPPGPQGQPGQGGPGGGPGGQGGVAGGPGGQTIQGSAGDDGFHVRAQAPAGGDGTTWAKAYNNLQEAIEAAASNDKAKVYVAQGSYKPTDAPNGGAIGRSNHFSLRNGVEVIGGYSGQGSENNPATYKTILSGDLAGDDTDDIKVNRADNVYHVFYHPDGINLDRSAKLTGVTIVGGYADGQDDQLLGGGMFNEHSSPTLKGVVFRSNVATRGGGMFNEDKSSPALENVMFTKNKAVSQSGSGGGMYNLKSSPELKTVTFTGNEAYKGGGMFNEDESSPALDSFCKFENNKAGYDFTKTLYIYGSGGGMYNLKSSPKLKDVTFSGNEAANGGGMYNTSSSPKLKEVTFSGNEAPNGGGMYNTFSAPELEYVTFTGNTAKTNGGGVYNDGHAYGTGHTKRFTKLENVTFASNKATDGGGMYNKDSNPDLKGVTFKENRANVGGGMYNYRSTPALKSDCKFENNKASYRGGGMYNLNSLPTLRDTTFTENKADYHGGGMFNDGHSSPKLNTVTFTTNNAVRGGGMYNASSSSPNLTNCTFTSNTTTNKYGKGGAVFSDTDSNPTFDSATQSSFTPLDRDPNGRNNGNYKETS